MRALTVIAVLLVGVGLHVERASAQTATPIATYTATPTPTPSPSPTSPELNVIWTLEAPDSAPGQAVMLSYIITIDHVVAAVLLLVILVILWVGIALALVRGWL